jgi:predicted amidohydrolase YtcJ
MVLETEGERIHVVARENERPCRPDAIVLSDGCLVLPAFHDAHAHLLFGALQVYACDFRGVATTEHFADVLLTYMEERQKQRIWVQGCGLDETQLRLTRHDIERVCAERPVFIWTHDLHSAVVNGAALEWAGVHEDTPDPEGGTFERDAMDRMTGVLRESAAHLVESAIPPLTPEQVRHTFALAQGLAFSNGITAVSCSVRDDHWPHYLAFASSPYRKIRLNVWRATDRFDFQRDRFEKIDGVGCRFAAFKGFLDGSLGSRSAALWEPYHDDPSTRSVPLAEEEHLARFIEEAHTEGYQVAFHAIGDRANSLALDAIEAAGKRTGRRDSRPRIEHAQHLRAEDMPRFADLGVIASMQPTHCTADMHVVEPRLGPGRARRSYAWRSLLGHGAKLCFGSDWPVEFLRPMAGIHAAVTRQDMEGEPEGGWQPQERITVEEALRAYTSGSAYAAFWEGEMGLLKEGMLADFVVISNNILECEPSAILRTSILMTIAGGELVFRNPMCQT